VLDVWLWYVCDCTKETLLASTSGRRLTVRQLQRAQRTKKLNLQKRGLTALPPEIGQLTSLRRLDLRGNQLTALPPEIGQLTSLQMLWLDQNLLTELLEIGQLNPRTISLTDNRLFAAFVKKLPKQFVAFLVMRSKQFVAFLKKPDPAFHMRLLVAIGAYSVSAIFGLAFLLTRIVAPHTSLLIALGVAIGAAVPLALALLWGRLTSLKIGPVQIDLIQITVELVRPDLADAVPELAELGTDAAPDVSNKVLDLVETPATKLVEVNLRAEPYWWPARLFLLAALLVRLYGHSPRGVRHW
jgi:Leucine rich repeat